MRPIRRSIDTRVSLIYSTPTKVWIGEDMLGLNGIVSQGLITLNRKIDS